jgi:hypothetical protein
MRTLFITLALIGFGCGDDDGDTTDAAPPPPPPIDAAIDSPPGVALNCTTLCNQVQTNCTGTNAQYTDMAHCTGACATFTVGTSTVNDTAGDTLGCRIYHSGTPSMTAPGTHCVHTGPAGDNITLATPAFCSGGNVCRAFCTEQIKTCGTTTNQVTVGGVLITAQYASQMACETACASFDKTHPYAINAAGDSLACRLNHWTNAASFAAQNNGASTQLHCTHTAATPTGPCAGTATP